MQENKYSEELLEEAKRQYDAERFWRLTPYPEVRERFNGEACHDIAIHVGVDADELADYILSVDGYRPDPRVHDDS